MMPLLEQRDRALAAGRQDIADEALISCGFDAGAKAERDRIRSIMECDAAVGREGTALHIGVRTTFTLPTAIEILSSAPIGDAPARNVRPIKTENPWLWLITENGKRNDQN
jgi:hypothetical protein